VTRPASLDAAVSVGLGGFNQCEVVSRRSTHPSWASRPSALELHLVDRMVILESNDAPAIGYADRTGLARSLYLVMQCRACARARSQI
jgi:hypothetical protein